MFTSDTELIALPIDQWLNPGHLKGVEEFCVLLFDKRVSTIKSL